MRRLISRNQEVIACFLLFFVFFTSLAGETRRMERECAPSRTLGFGSKKKV